MSKEEFKKDVQELRKSWENCRPYENEFLLSAKGLKAYEAYWNKLQELTRKYKCSERQIADCMNV